MRAGPSGFVINETPARRLAEMVRTVVSGRRVIDSTLAAETPSTGNSPLSDRDADVLCAALRGGTNADIAHYLSSAIGKTQARTRSDAVRIAEHNGWLLR